MQEWYYDLPEVVKYRLLVYFKMSLPFDTGNLRYNAAGMQSKQPGAVYFINELEADYTQRVFEHYIYRKGRNFMYEAAVRMFNFLEEYFKDKKPELSEQYQTFRRNLLANAKSTPERDLQNFLRGTGNYVRHTTKKELLGEVDERFRL